MKSLRGKIIQDLEAIFRQKMVGEFRLTYWNFDLSFEAYFEKGKYRMEVFLATDMLLQEMGFIYHISKIEEFVDYILDTLEEE